MSQIKTVYVIKDMITHGYYIKTDKDGSTWWTVSPFSAKNFKSRKEAFDVSCKLDNLVIIVDIAWKEGCQNGLSKIKTEEMVLRG